MTGTETTILAGNTKVFQDDTALNIKDMHDDVLSSLHIITQASDFQRAALQDLSVIVVGGGPSGLTFAKAASSHGAKVTVLEKAGDPRGKNPGYTDRSFNITLNNVGRFVLGDNMAWQGGVRIVGRAIHAPNNGNEVQYTRYGATPNFDLISVPRPMLRQNMANLASDKGTTIHFNAQVTRVEPDRAEVTFTGSAGNEQTLSADLVVISDGFHSLGDRLVLTDYAEDHYYKPEIRSCVSAMLYPTDLHNLSLHHIHFWHTPSANSYVLGIPNSDGSIALLLASLFEGIDSGSHPFATSQKAHERLQRDFPDLYALCPQLAERLPKQRRYRFYHKALTSYRAGTRGVVVGDAGCAMPPWAGFGANSAMYGASTLVYQLIKHQQDMDSALNAYQSHMHLLSRQLLDYVSEQSEFFNGGVAQKPNARPDAELALLIKRVSDESNR